MLEPLDDIVTTRRARGRRGPGEGAIYRREDGRWTASVELDRVGGKRRRKVLYGRTKAELLDKLREAQQRKATGKPAMNKRHTTVQWLTYWATEVLPGTVADSTAEGYGNIVRRDVVPYVGHVPLDELAPAHVHQMMRALEDRGLGPRTVAYARAVLRRALRVAERWELVTRNAAALVDPPRQRRREPDHLDLETASRILAAAPADRLGALYVLAVTCGLRRGELLALWWEDVDLDNAVVHVRAGLKRIRGKGLVRDEPKTARSRRSVPLPAVTVEALRLHRRRSLEEALALGQPCGPKDFAFTSPTGTPIDPSNLTDSWHAFCMSIGVPRTRLHALRHTAATLLLTQGVPLTVISRTLGHSGLAITADIYADVVPQLQRDAADAMQKAFKSVGETG